VSPFQHAKAQACLRLIFPFTSLPRGANAPPLQIALCFRSSFCLARLRPRSTQCQPRAAPRARASSPRHWKKFYDDVPGPRSRARSCFFSAGGLKGSPPPPPPPPPTVPFFRLCFFFASGEMLGRKKSLLITKHPVRWFLPQEFSLSPPPPPFFFLASPPIYAAQPSTAKTRLLLLVSFLAKDHASVSICAVSNIFCPRPLLLPKNTQPRRFPVVRCPPVNCLRTLHGYPVGPPTA